MFIHWLTNTTGVIIHPTKIKTFDQVYNSYTISHTDVTLINRQDNIIKSDSGNN